MINYDFVNCQVLSHDWLILDIISGYYYITISNIGNNTTDLSLILGAFGHENYRTIINYVAEKAY